MTFAALALLLAAAPLECPAGTTRAGAAPFDGYAEWCEGRPDAYGRPRRHGPARTFYDDGGIWIEEHFREGERDGPFLERHRNGRRASEGAFARGRKTGRWIIWSESGGVEEEASFRDGVRDGPFASFWPGGKPRTTGRHCGGAQCGRWRTFDDSGREVGSVDYGEQSAVP